MTSRSEPRDRQDDEPRRWPGTGWVEAGEVVRYAGHVWRCVKAGAGKPKDGSPQWQRLD
jgi:hypothetical protein